MLRASVRGAGEGTVYFHGHFDVIPTAQSAKRAEARRAGGRIVGRGTADMKGGLVSMLYGAAAARGASYDGNPSVCDGRAASPGQGRLQQPTWVACRRAGDGHGRANQVPCDSRGAITLFVEVRGRAAGQALFGVDAASRMVQIAELASLAHELLARRARADSSEEAAGRWMWAGRRAAVRASTSCRARPGPSGWNVSTRSSRV